MEVGRERRMYRQGDVLLVEVDPDTIYSLGGKLKAGLKKADEENGRVVLAHGEVTGHHHAFRVGSNVVMFREDGSGSGLFSNAAGSGTSAAPRHGFESIPRANDGTLVPGQRRFVDIGSVNVDLLPPNGKLVEDPAPVAFLDHDEHETHEITKGVFEVIIQREYVAPQRNRFVED
jgi:hypothetical protein